MINLVSAGFLVKNPDKERFNIADVFPEIKEYKDKLVKENCFKDGKKDKWTLNCEEKYYIHPTVYLLFVEVQSYV